MNSWKRVCIANVCESVVDCINKTAPTIDDPSLFKMIRTTNIRNGQVNLESVRYATGETYHQWTRRQIPTRGDILLTREAPMGEVGMLLTEDHVFLGQRIVSYRTNPDQLNNKFLLYAFQSDDLQNQIKAFASGSTVQHMRVPDTKALQIPLPSLPEQNQIVAILDEAFEGIDRAIANTKKNLTNARELFESYLNAAFTQKGDGWVEKKLGDICENLDSRRIPITKSDRKSGDVPYYGASGVVDYVADYIFDEDLLLVSEDGANLLARTYPIAFSISGKTWVNNHAHTLRFDRICSQYFVEYYLNSISLEQYVSGMAQPKLNQKQLNSIPVPFPTQIQQQQIVAKLDELRSETQRLESIYRQKLAALNELKQTILQKAFTGELTADTANQATKIAEGAIAA